MKSIVLFTLLILTASAFAIDTDLHLGTFSGVFANYTATYELTSKTKGEATFFGRLILQETKQDTKVRIEQRKDHSLRITRYLEGPDAGKKQYVETYPPEILTDSIRFAKRVENGVGMRTSGTWLIMPRK